MANFPTVQSALIPLALSLLVTCCGYISFEPYLPQEQDTGAGTDLDTDSDTDSDSDSDTDTDSDADIDTDSETDTGTDCECTMTTWLEDSAAHFTDNDPTPISTHVITPGSVVPTAYRTGGWLMTGHPGMVIADPDSATWADVMAAGETGRKISGDLSENWKQGIPLGLGIANDDNFTVGFYGEIELEHAQTYAFTIDVDDAAILEIHDGTAWQRIASAAFGITTVYFTVLDPGWHPIRVAVSEATGNGLFELRWEAPSVPLEVVPSKRLRLPLSDQTIGLEMLGHGLEYNAWFSGHRLDSTSVNHDWGDGGFPAEIGVVNDDEFSVRWVGQVRTALSGDYDFRYVTDDGQRLWIDGVELLNNWDDNAYDNTTGTIWLEQGWHDIVVDQTENNGSAQALLHFGAASPELANTIIPADRFRPTTRANLSSTGNADYPIQPFVQGGETNAYLHVAAPRNHTIDSVDVCFSINGDSGDYEITLHHPNGVTSELIQDNQNDDEICYLNLFTFDGLVAGGEWRLQFVDTENNDTGTIDYWSVVVHHLPPNGTPWDPGAHYVSQVFDAGVFSLFGELTYDVTLPINAGVTLTTRSADSLADLDTASWSAPLASSELITSPANRYFQYRVQFDSGDTQQGSLDRVEIEYCPCEE